MADPRDGSPASRMPAQRPLPGQVSRAARILDDAGLTAPASEAVLVQSATTTADAPAFRAAVDQVLAGVTGTGRATYVRSPYDTGAVSADGRSVLVRFNVAGGDEVAVKNVTAVLDAVAAATGGRFSPPGWSPARQ
ncbi:hypothetical protein ACFVXQ_10605 [Kitasatospora sp. NPDC058263]